MARPSADAVVARCTRCDTPAFKVSPDGRTFWVKCARQGCDQWHEITATMGLVRERDGRESAVVDGDRQRVQNVPAGRVTVEGPDDDPPGLQRPPRGPYRPG